MQKKNFSGKDWGSPGAFAISRNHADGDIAAGILLYRIQYRWNFSKRKLHRHGKEWVAMSRSNWAREAGLTDAEMKNRALPRLRKCEFVDIRQMRLSPREPKLLWVSLDLDLLKANTTPWDMYDPIMKGMKVIGQEKKSAYPYGKSDEAK
ncbi:MAG: hypothetical protein HN725_18290 [Alphaproteobacteria bacterium]|jgi:hypothetical protein|nr:hypothetical protein [Alphaproteobacteria bacterium]MBT4546729.1 hypothetical protein [Alphaproteobacteria bacterium]MBT7747243.1 hypothetical protein [Alphaproteobacteria bacterium]